MSKKSETLAGLMGSQYQQLFLKKHQLENELADLKREYEDAKGISSKYHPLEREQTTGQFYGEIKQCEKRVAYINGEIENSSDVLSKIVGRELVETFIHGITKMTDAETAISTLKREKKALDDESDTYDEEYDALEEKIQALNKDTKHWANVNQKNRWNLILKLGED